ncbi:MAG: hypothetical protein ABR971_16175 [Acidobacteriaceae bacterium]
MADVWARIQRFHEDGTIIEDASWAHMKRMFHEIRTPSIAHHYRNDRAHLGALLARSTNRITGLRATRLGDLADGSCCVASV